MFDVSSLLIFTSFLTYTTAWSTATSHNRCISSSIISSSELPMASRGAQKWERKKAWLEKRGYPIRDASGEEEKQPSNFCTVIGGGRIGSLLVEGGESLLLNRGDSIPTDGSGPIIIATRNDALDGIVESCPENRRKDLVFLQNGYLDDFLKSTNLQDNTQVLLYLSVPAKGVNPVDGITSVNPEGLTTATGEHADAFKARLSALGLKCNVVSADEYEPAMFEKLIWISTYMLVGTAKGSKSVGEAGSEHKDLLNKVIDELVTAVSVKESITFQPGAIDRLAAYTDVVADFPCGVKEFEWRNKYFYSLGDEACPTHNSLLRDCKEAGLLTFELE